MSKKESFWIPYADLMTVLMIVFLFISVGYMAILQKQKKNQDKIFTEYKESKLSLYNELNNEFKDDFEKWDLELGKDLSIKFTNPDVLFASGQSSLTPKFKNILSEFIPKYLNIILSEKYKDKIIEVRIEGHTDDVRRGITNDDYIDNVALSQDRAREVLAFTRSLSFYENLSKEKEELLRFLLTANGLSYGRTLDSEKKYTYETKKSVDKLNSRRVEFKIVTSSEQIVNEVVKGLE